MFTCLILEVWFSGVFVCCQVISWSNFVYKCVPPVRMTVVMLDRKLNYHTHVHPENLTVHLNLTKDHEIIRLTWNYDNNLSSSSERVCVFVFLVYKKCTENSKFSKNVLRNVPENSSYFIRRMDSGFFLWGGLVDFYSYLVILNHYQTIWV